MKTRCNNENCWSYVNYGGRGIAVCQEWEQSFETFRTWALANGYADDLSIDRVDNDSGYSPTNCRWANKTTQNQNTRKAVIITAFGETKKQRDWLKDPRCKVNLRTLRSRLSKGWPPEIALSKPPDKTRLKHDQIDSDLALGPVG